MNDHLVIAISREFGSGGRLIGEKLALELGIPFYDKDIIEMAAKKSGLSTEFFEQLEEKASSSFLFNLVTTAYASPAFFSQYDIPISHKAFYAQVSVIQELADRGSCVIVGRCADYILRDHPNCVKVFVYASKEDRVKRAVDHYEGDARVIEDKLNKIDKGRANYYKHFTNETWGSAHAHDLCINTSCTGIDGAVKLVRALLDVRQPEEE